MILQLLSLSAKYEKTISINGIIKNMIYLDLTLMNCSNIYPLFKKFGVDDRFNSTGINLL